MITAMIASLGTCGTTLKTQTHDTTSITLRQMVRVHMSVHYESLGLSSAE